MRKGKRLLSILLCLAMVCSLLPAAMAENGEEGQLLFKYGDTGLRDMTQFPTEVGTNHDLYFYYGTAESSVAVATITSSKTDVVTISAGTNGCYRVYIAGAGTTTLTYTVDGTDRTVDVTIPEVSEEEPGGGPTTLAMTAYQYNNETATGYSFPGGLEANCPDTFFLQFKAGNTVVTSFENSNTAAVRVSESETAGVMKVELLAPGTAILSTSVDLTPYMFMITVLDSTESGETTAEIGLKFRRMYWDGANYVERTDWPLESSWTSGIGYSSPVKFYFYDGSKEIPVALEDLVFSEHVSGNQPEGQAYIDLSAEKFGKGTISYTMDGKTHVLPITVTLREIDFYSAQSASEASYLESFKVTESDNVFYLVSTGRKLSNVTLQTAFENIADVKQISEYCWEITVTGTPQGHWYYLNLVAIDEEGNPSDEGYGIELQDAKPGLKFRRMDWNDDGHFENPDSPLESSWFTGIGYDNPVKFYFYDGSKEIPVALKDLVFSEHVSGSQPAGQDYIDLSAEKFGEGTISYTIDGKTYSIAVTVTLREFGFYSTQSASEASYLESFTVTDELDVFYFVANEGTLTDITLDERFEQIANVEKISDTCWKIIVTGDADGRRYSLSYSGTDIWNNSFSDWGGSIQIVDAKPGLKFRRIDRNDDGHFENPDSPLENSWSTGIGYGNPVKFYFYDGSKEIPVALKDLVFSEHVSGNQPEGQAYVDLRAEKFGKGTISYAVDGKTYSISVTVTLREFDFYSTQSASEASYLESFKVTESDNVFYLVSTGRKLSNVTLQTDFENIADVKQISEYCWEITVTGTPEGHWYYLDLVAIDEEGNPSDQGYGIELQDAKPGLKFRRMDWNDDGHFENPDIPLESNWTSGIGYGNPVKFYFYDGTKEIPVTLENLVFSEHVSGSQPAGQDYVDLRAEKYGSGTVSYSFDGKTYSVTVEVGLPNFGFYSTETATPESYLHSFILTEDSKEFYFVAYGDSKITEVKLEGNNGEIAEAVKISDTCWKITITGRVYSQFDFFVTYSGTQGDYPFSGWGERLVISAIKEQANPMTAISGSYILSSESWDPDDNVYEGFTSIEYVSEDTRFFQFKAGNTLITSGLSSKDSSIVRVGTTGLTETLGIWAIDMISGGVVTLSAEVDGTTYNFTVVITGYFDDSMTGNETPKVTVKGVEYSIGIGDARSNNYDSITFLGTGMSLGCHPGMVWFIAAVSGAGTNELTEAPAYVYQYIKDVSVELVSYTNMDSSGDQSVPNCTYTTGTMEYHGAEVPTILVGGEEGAYFVSKIRVTVVVQGPDDEEPVTYSWISSMSYSESLDLRVSAESLSTADALNEVLSSEDALYSWLEENYPNEYEQVITAHENDIEVSLRLELPGVSYDKVIVVNVPDRNISISFEGQRGLEKTTLPGMRISGQVGAVWFLSFVAQEDCTVSYDGETFTCGILVAGNNGEHGHILQIERSSFAGFDYAVRSTHDGIATGVYGCIISDCGVGYYMDSYETSMSQLYGKIGETCFIRNDCAIQIVSIHSGLSPYAIRVNDCDMIGNKVDFNIAAPGTFYFHSNYFAKVHNKSKDVSTSELIQTLAQATTETKLNQVVTSNAPRVNKAHGVKVITNPKWKYLIKGWAMYGMAPLALEEEEPYVNILTSDWASETQIVDTEAGNLKIDASAFEMETEEKKIIDVVDENENAIGTWIFD